MAETIRLPIPAEDLQKLIAGQTGIDDFIKELFAPKAAHDMLCNRLERYHWGDGTFPEVKAFAIEPVKFNTELMSGSFRTRFRVNYSFTCSGIETGENDTIDWTFTIDAPANNILFTGEEKLVRGMDEI